LNVLPFPPVELHLNLPAQQNARPITRSLMLILGADILIARLLAKKME
jgi:hypothetical protein